MTIILTGGGTGGHITPVLAVASELKKLRPDIRLIYVGQKGDQLSDVPASHPAIDAAYAVRAGKFRRYHGEGWRQIFDWDTQSKNIRDAFRVLAGIWQSYWLIRRLRPSIVFTRGGYVSVPVALGARLCGVPYVTHDSDSTPSLANRVIARWAVRHAVALPKEHYPYRQDKTVTVGVPVAGEYVSVDTKLQHEYRREIGFGDAKQLLLVTGGGNGAAWLNNVAMQNAPYLIQRYPGLAIVHVAGRLHEDEVRRAYDSSLPVDMRERVLVLGFTGELYKYSGAADVIITRSGASSLAEFAAQGKACVVIPAEQLIWQTYHADALAKHHAIVVLSEDEAAKDHALGRAVGELLSDRDKREELAASLGKLSHPDAAKQLAMLLLGQASGKK